MHLVGDPNELEDLFSDQQWADTANSASPRVTNENGPPQASEHSGRPESSVRRLSISFDQTPRRPVGETGLPV